MYIKFIAFCLCFALVGCGGGSGGSETDISETDATGTEPTDTDDSGTEPTGGTDATGTETAGTDATGTDTTGTDTDISELVADSFSTISCGTEVQGLVASVDQDNPAVLFAGEIGRGTVSGRGEDGVDSDHFWAFDVPEGQYVLVVEAQLQDNIPSNIGLEVTPTQLQSATEEPLFGSNEIRRRLRHSSFVTKTGSGIAALRVQSRFGIHNYHLGLYSTNESVAIPFLADCPPFRIIGPEATQAFNLNFVDTPSQWFAAELEAGVYEVVVDSDVASGVARNLIYNVLATNALNDIDSEIDVARVNEIDSSFTAIGRFELSSSQLVKLSVQVGRVSSATSPEYLMDFTVRRLQE